VTDTKEHGMTERKIEEPDDTQGSGSRFPEPSKDVDDTQGSGKNLPSPS
jgi:hypothetical protein